MNFETTFITPKRLILSPNHSEKAQAFAIEANRC
jgi:hypothetical protein